MSAFWINFLTAIFMYALLVIFYDQIWLGLAPMIFGGVAQLIVHGIVNNKILKTCYNLGLASVLLGHFPLMIAYIAYIHSNDLASVLDYIIAVIITIVCYVGVLRMLMPKILEDKNSPYPFSNEEMNKFDKLYLKNRRKI